MPIKYKCDSCDGGCVYEVSSEQHKPLICPCCECIEDWQLVEDAPEPAVCPVSAMQCAFARVVVECKDPGAQCPHRVESKICH